MHNDEMSDAAKLEACPFCGQPGAIEHLGNGQWSVGCGDDQECVGWMIGSTYARKAEAIAAWNRRAPEPRPERNSTPEEQARAIAHGHALDAEDRGYPRPEAAGLVEELERLARHASAPPWCGYSEYDVNLPYSLFQGTPGQEGFGPLDPLNGNDVDLIVALRNNLPAILAALRTPERPEADELLRDWWNPDPGDPYWMLEVRQGFENAGSWLKNEHSFLTTRDASKALRFPSRWAADYKRRQLPMSENGRFEPTEHIDMEAS